MVKRLQSSKHDILSSLFPIEDGHRALFEVLREARLNRHLSQQELARKLGVRQRQISDLERAAMDPRLSTIQNVARALDLELILIPRHLISAVEGLQRASIEPAKRPMYALADDAPESGSGDDRSHVEVGITGNDGTPTGPGRRPKAPR